MTSKAEFETQWADNTPAERRTRLDELALAIAPINENVSDDDVREHDALAGMVAADEKEALDAVTKGEGE